MILLEVHSICVRRIHFGFTVAQIRCHVLHLGELSYVVLIRRRLIVFINDDNFRWGRNRLCWKRRLHKRRSTTQGAGPFRISLCFWLRRWIILLGCRCVRLKWNPPSTPRRCEAPWKARNRRSSCSSDISLQPTWQYVQTAESALEPTRLRKKKTCSSPMMNGKMLLHATDTPRWSVEFNQRVSLDAF